MSQNKVRMKLIALVVGNLFLLLGPPSWAQKATIQDIPTDEETTISIKKVKPGASNDSSASSTSPSNSWEIVAGQAEISGEGELLTKEARRSWKKACEEWKTEIRELNKSNEVLILNCNSATCSSDQGETTCKSSADYRIKVKK